MAKIFVPKYVWGRCIGGSMSFPQKISGCGRCFYVDALTGVAYDFGCARWPGADLTVANLALITP